MRVWAVLAVLLLAGCSSSEEPSADVKVEVTETTGAIIGLVVDQVIMPLPGATVTVMAAQELTAIADEEGQFVFTDLAAGEYTVRATMPGYQPAQTTATVVAGDANPDLLKLQLRRLFDQDPVSDQFKMEGFLTCGYSVSAGITGITAPCVTDYTSILPVCPGGCAPELRELQGDKRNYVLAVEPGWQQMVVEMQWTPSAQGTSPRMGPTISYMDRTATHWFASGNSESPLRLQIDVGEVHPSNQQSAPASPYDPNMIPPEGLDDLLVFVNLRQGDLPAALAVNQQFEIFHHTFYYGLPPEEWSFIAGDELPF